MKKIFISSLCFTLSTFVYSQTILIDQVIFESGDNISVVFTDEGITEGDDGENVDWDFSNITGSDTVTWIGVDPLDHDIAQAFWPDSDLGSFIPAPLNDSVEFSTFEFYDFDEDRIATLGLYSIIKNKMTNEVDTQIVNYSTNTFEEFAFPISYLDEFESDYSGTVAGSFQGFDTEVKRGGEVVMKADATGTIHTPVGTFENVLRIKRIQTQYDTSFFEFGGQTFETIVSTENEIYDWLQPERKYTLFRVIYTTISYPGIPPQVNPPLAFYTIENGTSNTQEDNTTKISFYPNPTNDAISILNFDKINIKSIEIFDSSGRRKMVISEPLETISLSSLSAGVYNFRLNSDQGIYAQKFIKM